MATLTTSTDRTATSTNLISFLPDGSKRTMLEVIPLLARYGYRRLDLNFCEMMNPSSRIDGHYIARLKELREAHGLDYVQSHGPYPRDHLALDEDGRERFDSLIARAITYSVELGIPAIVIHPIKASVEENVAYLSRFLPLLEGSASILAVENMEGVDEISTADELCAIVDALPQGHIGVCLDTGHAHMRALDLRAQIEKLSHRLVATHIADNHGTSDEHNLPFFGTIDWPEVMKALDAVGYKGWLTYECMFFTRHLPRELEADVVALSLKIGSYLSHLS